MLVHKNRKHLTLISNFIGSWYRNTYKKMCRNENTILCPIILFWDGTSIDSKSRKNLYPLNFSLGIFNTATRRLKEAWKVLALFPSFTETMKETKDSSTTPQNFHTILQAATRSLKYLQQGPGLRWKFLHGGIEVEVNMKFPVAFINGDTEGHNRLAAKKGQSTHVCRICNVETKHCSDENRIFELTKQTEMEEWKKKGDHEKIEGLAYHAINNGLYGLDFGMSEQGLHSALAGEILHMVLYGLHPYAIQGLLVFVRTNTDSTKNMIVGKVLENLHQNLSRITRKLKHQSERSLPKYDINLKFLEQPTLNAFEFPAAILAMLIMLVSDAGREQLLIRRKLSIVRYCRFIHIFEMLLSVSEFFQKDEIKLGQLNRFEWQAKALMRFYKDAIQRQEGNGHNIIKFHLMLHVHMFMDMFGTMANFDSGPGESYHKTVIKTAARRTKRQKGTLNRETGARIVHQQVIERACRAYGLQNIEEYQKFATEH